MRVLKSSWPLLLSLATLFAAILICSNAATGWEKYQTVFYFARPITFLMTFLGIPLLMFITLLQFRHDKQSTTSLMSSLFVLVIASVLACGSTFTLMINSSSSVTELASENHVYRLDALFSPGIGGDHTSVLALWECDTWGVFCQIIDSETYDDGMKLMLQLDDNHALRFLVNNKVVYRRDDS